jgi:hypothetical protein
LPVCARHKKTALFSQDGFFESCSI